MGIGDPLADLIGSLHPVREAAAAAAVRVDQAAEDTLAAAAADQDEPQAGSEPSRAEHWAG